MEWSSGQLGHGNQEGRGEGDQWVPKRVEALKEKVVAVSAGFGKSLALTAMGVVYSCGTGAEGQPGKRR